MKPSEKAIEVIRGIISSGDWHVEDILGAFIAIDVDQILAEKNAEIERLNVMIRSDAMDSRNLSNRINEQAAEIARLSVELSDVKHRQSFDGDYLKSRIAELEAEIAKAKERIEQLRDSHPSLQNNP